MRTHRLRNGRHVWFAGGLAAAAVALVVAGPISGAGGSGERAAAEAWRGAFATRPQVDLGRRMIVVLAVPSLADRMAEASRPLSPKAQRRYVAQAELVQRRVLAALRVRGVKVKRELSFTRTLNGFSAVLDARAVAALEAMPGIVGVYPVRTVYPAAVSGEDAAAPDLRPSGALPGADGSGVTVALLDTGVDRSRPALAGRVLRGVDLFAGDRDARAEPSPASGELETHGTRMAGIVASAAPGATLLPIRVLGWTRAADGAYHELGRGDVLLAGLERAVDPDGNGDVTDAARVALAAVVEPYAAFADSPEARAVAGALQLGTLVVAAAGNDGPAANGFGTVGAPGGAPAALTVGAADLRALLTATPELPNPGAGSVAAFSSHGPAFDGRAKPDVVAAGVGVATIDAGSGDFVSATGSSAAAAVAAGAAAVVAQARPALDALTLRSVLVGSARPLAAPSPAQGAGLIDVQAASAADLAVEPATVLVGQTVRIRNLSTRTLRVAVYGAPATLSVRPRRLTLRPGQAGEVRVAARLSARATGSGVLTVGAAGAQPARVLWTALAGLRHTRLVSDLHLSRSKVAALSFRAGWVSESRDGVGLEPVGLLEVELWTVRGKRLGVLARLRDLLPGRYSVELTGRGPNGRPLEPGAYVVRLRAHSADVREGHAGRTTVAAVRFTVHPSR